MKFYGKPLEKVSFRNCLDILVNSFTLPCYPLSTEGNLNTKWNVNG
jgi:hypothetical protein